ncbi:MAG: hypothetical protein WC108_08235, partial [Bacteroidales bacterium]
SMVLATQQPSAINSKVLSQVDIFLSHKLVFNDDIHAVQKRMPAIIPEAYKDPNFIKTLPVGVALTGDRGEETKRAFILKIKPRLSQHEGRDAETIREVPTLSKKEIINFCSDMIYKKLLSSKTLKTSDAKDILDVINSKYNSDVLFDEILVSLSKMGITEKDNILHFENKNTKQKTEIPKSEIQDINRAIERSSEEQEITPETIEPETLPCLPIRISKEIAVNISRSTSKKNFLIFKENETIINAKTAYRKLYKIDFDIFDEKEHYKSSTCYMDSVSGEFMHFDGREFKESTGFGLLEELTIDDILLLDNLDCWITARELAKELQANEEEIKQDLFSLADRNLIDISKSKEEDKFRIKRSIDIPFSPKHEIIPSLKNLSLKKQLISRIDIDEELTNEYFCENLEKLWQNIEIKNTEEIYWPIWKIKFIDKKANERIVIVDSVLGQIIDA